jgi:chromosome segregation ATPase
MALEDAQARLAQAEQRAQEVEGLTSAFKEKSDAVVAVEGQVQEERTAREGAQTQLALRDAALAEAQTQLERERKALEVVYAQLSQATRKIHEAEYAGAAIEETWSQLQLAHEELKGERSQLQQHDASILQLE